MLVILGALTVFATVFGGYLMEGGHLEVLIQPVELMIIGGACLGGLLISAPTALLKQIVGQVLNTIKRGGTTKTQYTELLLLLFELCKTAKANPLSLEPHVEKPQESEIFKRYPGVLANHHAVHFICDTLKVQISSPMNPYDLEELMDTDLTAAHDEEGKAPTAIARVGDALP